VAGGGGRHIILCWGGEGGGLANIIRLISPVIKNWFLFDGARAATGARQHLSPKGGKGVVAALRGDVPGTQGTGPLDPIPDPNLGASPGPGLDAHPDPGKAPRVTEFKRRSSNKKLY